MIRRYRITPESRELDLIHIKETPELNSRIMHDGVIYVVSDVLYFAAMGRVLITLNHQSK